MECLVKLSIKKMENKKTILGVIPARYQSSRFEGKPLVKIKGIPMIKRTYMQALKSNLLDKIVVATEDKRIIDYCQMEDIPVVMTTDTCLTGTDRVAEVSQQMDYDFYVNIQGDEPIIDPSSIEQIVEMYLTHGNDYIAYNLYKVINDMTEVNSDTIIKVITNVNDEVMYMSRLPIPFSKGKLTSVFKQQIPVYGFTKKALSLFSSYEKTLNEKFEDIELLRFVDLGFKLKMIPTTASSIAVDVPADLAKVEDYLTTHGLD
jgi:3-deoxy-manno-octulosonate cytidylyltransferase (CMP-KDO synthetase)